MWLLRTNLVNVLLKTDGVRDGIADFIGYLLLFSHIVHQVVYVINVPITKQATTFTFLVCRTVCLTIGLQHNVRFVFLSTENI